MSLDFPSPERHRDKLRLQSRGISSGNLHFASHTRDVKFHVFLLHSTYFPRDPSTPLRYSREFRCRHISNVDMYHITFPRQDVGVGFIRTTFTLLGIAGRSYVGMSSAMAAGLTRTARVPSEEIPGSVGLDYRDVSFTSRGGYARLSGWIIPPESGANSPQTTARGTSWIVMLHGGDTNRCDSKTGMLGIASELSNHGFGVFMFDLRERGDSPAAMSSSGYFERLDLQGASGYLVSKGSDRSRIGVLGFALGGSVSLMAGSNPNNFGAVVSDSAFADYSLF